MLNARSAAALIALFVCVSPSGTTQAQSIPNVDIVQHDLRLTPDFTRHVITGVQRITFKALRDDTTRVAFSENGLKITRASFGLTPLDVSHQNGQTVLSLPRSLQRGQETIISVFYEGVPKRGLTFGRQTVYTSYFTCDWMFCQQDRPGDKARFNLTLRLPRGMMSVGTGTRIITPAGGGLEDHFWLPDRQFSSYLFGFAAGAFQRASTRPGNVEFVYLSEDESPENLTALLGSTAGIYDFFLAKGGIRMTQRQYTQVVVPGNAAQEAAAFSVLGADVVKPILDNPQEDWAIAHELAHQWWGNLVTCETWDEMWLNEGIATFMVAAWKEHRWGRAAYDREMMLLRQRLDTAVEAGFDVPLTYTGDYPTAAIRRAIIYSKGALFMDQLRRELGDDLFWRALQQFTRSNAGQTVTSRDFQRTFERTTGRDLFTLFDRWVY